MLTCCVDVQQLRGFARLQVWAVPGKPLGAFQFNLCVDMCFHFRGSVPGAGRLGCMRASVSFHETAGQVPGRPFSAAGRWLPPRASSQPRRSSGHSGGTGRTSLCAQPALLLALMTSASFRVLVVIHISSLRTCLFISFAHLEKNCVPGGRGEFFTFRVQMVCRRCGQHTFSPGLLLVFSFS